MRLRLWLCGSLWVGSHLNVQVQYKSGVRTASNGQCSWQNFEPIREEPLPSSRHRRLKSNQDNTGEDGGKAWLNVCRGLYVSALGSVYTRIPDLQPCWDWCCMVPSGGMSVHCVEFSSLPLLHLVDESNTPLVVIAVSLDINKASLSGNICSNLQRVFVSQRLTSISTGWWWYFLDQYWFREGQGAAMVHAIRSPAVFLNRTWTWEFYQL